MRRWALPLAGAAVLAALAGLWAAQHPRSDRPWVMPQQVPPQVRFDGTRVAIEHFRNFAYAGPDRFAPAWEQRSFDLAAVESAWFALTPFSLHWRGPAHTFLSFGFADGGFLAISVEARREVGEEYSVLLGMLRRYELIYVIGDERDLIGQRAAFGDDPLYLYPIEASRERIRGVLEHMLRRAEALRTTPEFYNTVTNNCTSNILAHVNAVAPRRIATGWRTLLPGYADEVAFELGLLDTDLPLAAARERFRVNAQARGALGKPDFSRRIREIPAATGP